MLTMDLDRVTAKVMPYLAIFALLVLVVSLFLLGGSEISKLLIPLFGVSAGVVASYYIYLHLEQEKKVDFMEGEDVLLESTSSRSYVVYKSVGEQDLPFEPVRVNTYLTNLGILCEPPGSGESVIYVPLDKITEFRPHNNGLLVRYVDVNFQYAEVLLYVGDVDKWMRELNSQLNQQPNS